MELLLYDTLKPPPKHTTSHDIISTSIRLVIFTLKLDKKLALYILV